jgi:hypothetical protein
MSENIFCVTHSILSVFDRKKIVTSALTADYEFEAIIIETSTQ